ncbi:MAG: phosphate acetyltransferase [Solitalea-like symbiont of Tyrophagus putrescentiae]
MNTKTNAIYIISDKPSTGKTELAVSLIKGMLSTHTPEDIVYFEPVYNKHTLNEKLLLEITHLGIKVEQLFTYDSVIKSYSLGEFDEVINQVIEGYHSVLDNNPNKFIVIEGFDPACYSLSLDINHNITFAKNLNAPVLIMINALNDYTNEVITRTNSVCRTIKLYGLSIAGVIINNLSRETFNEIKVKGETGFDADIINNIEFVLKSTNLDVNPNKILEKINNTKSDILTPQAFKYKILQKVKSISKHIVLPEGKDERILKAAVWLLNASIMKITLLGNRNQILEKLRAMGLSTKAEAYLNIINLEETNLNDYTNTLYELRKDKGLSLDEAKELIMDSSYYGSMMVYKGDADGMVSGAMNTTAHTVRPALQFIKTKPGIQSVSSIFFMCLDKKVVIYGDCAITPSPGPEQLADTAILAASYAKAMDMEPRIAMLSYSTGASAEGTEVNKIIEATQIVKNKAPELLVDGPLQYDAAVSKMVAESKLPGSKVAGQANIFIFPDLNSGNIAYKAVQREARAIAIGPVLQGLNKPINDLSRGCSIEDVINTVLVTALQSEFD